MCMSKGAPKKPEFGPCQEQHGLGNLNLNDPKTFGEVMGFMFFVAAMGPVISSLSNLVKVYSNSTTAVTLP